MSFLLVKRPDDSLDDEALMEALGVAAGLRKLQRTTRTCLTLGHPATEFIGWLDGQEVRIGGDLLLDIPVPYAAHVCVTGRPTRRRAQLRSSLLARMEAAGFHVVIWPADSVEA